MIALGLLILVLALIFAVPRRPEPPRALDHRGEAFVDRASLVSKDCVWTTAGMLLREERYQMVVYADPSLPDVLVHRLLEDRLAPRFAAGDCEGGFDAFIKSVGEALHKLRLELGGRPPKGTYAMLLDTHAEGIERAPRMARATWRADIEGGPTERLFALICVGIFLPILAATVMVATVTVAIVVKLARGRPDAADAPAVSGSKGIAAAPGSRSRSSARRSAPSPSRCSR